MNILEMIIVGVYGTVTALICEKTIWKGWPTIAKDWGWKQWMKWLIYPGFYLGLLFIFLTVVTVMKTVREVWFQ